MSKRTKRIEFLVTPEEKAEIHSLFLASGEVSKSSFLRSLALNGEKNIAPELAMVESRLSMLQLELVQLKFELEAALDMNLSKVSEEIDVDSESAAFHFCLFAEKFRSFYLEVQQLGNS